MTANLRLSLLGSAHITRDGQPAPGPPPAGQLTGKMLALLGYLVVRRQPLSREHLADLFWQDLPAERGRANLSWTLHKLSPLLPGCLQAGRRTVEFCRPDDCWIDLDAFESLVARGDARSLAEAAAPYRGAFLQGLSLDGCADFELWLVGEQERWRQRAEHALGELIAYHSGQGACGEALRYARRLLALAPWREETHRAAMRLLAESGQRGAALAQYEACCRALETELGVAPSEETTALYEQIVAGQVAGGTGRETMSPSFPSSSTSPSHNLPAPTTPFIGRETQLAEVRALLARPEVRLLTLTGVGGTGKTRLALQVAAGLVEKVRDGVYWVALAPLRDPALVVPTIAAALGVRESGDTPLLDSLKYALRDRERLLVIDNFEQVVEAAPAVGELLAAAPRLKVLATSRAPLHVYGEHEYCVPPMEVPHPRLLALSGVEGPCLEPLARAEAVSLFVQGVRQVQPDFALDEGNAPAVAEICARLDGLPLAIELAAARVKLFSPQAMLALVRARPDGANGRSPRRSPLRFLTGGPRDLPARQRTLRATIEWSYDLLDADERTLFARLSVFAGGCTLAAAETVALSSLLSEPETCNLKRETLLDTLQSLVDQNLLQASKADGEPRFTMLETIREYALERLAENGEESAVRERHARYFLTLAQGAKADWYGPAELPWLDRLQAEYDSLRAALAWWVEGDAGPGDVDAAAVDASRAAAVAVAPTAMALQLAGALGRFWYVRGYLGEGRDWLTAALAKRGADSPGLKRWRAEALSWAGYMRFMTGDSAAVALLSESLALWRELGEMPGLLWTLGRLALVLRRSEPAQARSLVEEATLLARRANDSLLLSYALVTDGHLAMEEGQYERARANAEEGLGLARTIGAIQVMAWAKGVLGRIASAQGDYATAQSSVQECIALFRQARDTTSVAEWSATLGDVQYTEGDYDMAETSYQESLQLWRETGSRSVIVSSLTKLVYVALRHGRPEETRARLTEALTLCRETMSMDTGVAACLVGWAGLAEGQGQPKRAARLLGAAAEIQESVLRPLNSLVPLEHERLVAAVRAQLDEATFAAAWDEGRTMTQEQALTCAWGNAPIPARPGPTP